jgi:hypothetical protein
MKHWLRTPLEAFAGKTPQELIADGRIRDLVIEFDRLREGQPAGPSMPNNARRSSAGWATPFP